MYCTYASDREADGDPFWVAVRGTCFFIEAGPQARRSSGGVRTDCASLNGADARGEEEAMKHAPRAPPPQALSLDALRMPLACASSTAWTADLREQGDSGGRGRRRGDAAAGRADGGERSPFFLEKKGGKRS